MFTNDSHYSEAVGNRGVAGNGWFQLTAHPVLLVIAGPSGVGKDTVARALIERDPDGFYFVVTATTRPPRPGEVEGVDYFFVSNDEFARMIDDDELIEYAIVYNDYKGVPKRQIREALASGRNVVMRVDVQGAATIRRLIPEATTVFLTAESEAAMVKRLRERKSETDSQLSLRIATARKEMQRLAEYDYLVVNADGRAGEAVETLAAIVRAERARVNRQPVVIR